MNLSTQVAIVTGLFALVLGAIVWIRRERTRTTLPFSLVCLSITVFCAGKILWLLTGKEWFSQASSVGGLFALASFYYLLVIYMAVEGRLYDLSVVGLFALAGIGSILRFAPRFDPTSGLSEEWTAIVIVGLTATVVIISVVWLFRRAIQEAPGQQRKLLITLIVLLVVLLTVFGLEKILRPYSPIQPWSLMLVSLFLYFLHQAVVRYRFFGLANLIGKTMLLLTSAVFLALIYGLLIYLIGTKPIHFGFHTLVAAFLLLILYEPVLSKVEAGTLRWLARGGRDKRHRLGMLARDLAERISVEDVLAFLEKTLPGELGFSGASIFFLSSDKFVRSGKAGLEPRIIDSPLLLEILQEENGPFYFNQMRRRALDRYPGPARDLMQRLLEILYRIPATVLFPLRYQDSLAGFWAIDTRGGPELQAETGEVLMTIADQAALRIENARIFERLQIKDRLATVGEMAAGLAHEIRNPLGSMKGAAEYLQDEPIPAASKEFVQIILEEVARLNVVLGRFLDYARPFKVDRKNVDVVQLVARTCALLQADEAAQAVGFEIEGKQETIFYDLDPELFRQVLINLAKNSIEAMEGQGILRFSVSNTNEKVVIDISDEGPGIPPEQLDQIFQPFFSTKGSGTGLGLAITRRICEAHGGVIFARSNQDRGTTFTIEFPATKSEEQ